MDASDRELIEGYRNGEIAALEDLVTKYRRQLFGYILNMTGNSSEADDVFQEVWLRVIRKLSLYNEKNFLGWLVRIAHNIVIDRYRRKKPVVSLDKETDEGQSLMATVVAKDGDPEKNAQMGEVGTHIAEAVAQLPDDQKEVFVMRARTGLTFKEIAKVQAVSINTVLARMQYAITKLRPLLQEDYANL